MPPGSRLHLEGHERMTTRLHGQLSSRLLLPDDDASGDRKRRLSAAELQSPGRRCWCCRSVRLEVVLSVLVASCVAMLLGYDIGVMSAAKRVLGRDLGLSDGQIEALVGSLNLVSAAGGLVSGSLADSCLGRRGTVAFACATSVAGSVVMAAAPSGDSGFAVLMVGRTLCGVAVGSGIMISPLYISELAPRRLREKPCPCPPAPCCFPSARAHGANCVSFCDPRVTGGGLVSFFEVAINIGILLGFVAGWAFRGLPDAVSWRWMLGVGGLPPLLVLFCLCWMPESPRWLVGRGREAEATRVLHQVQTGAHSVMLLSSAL